ncbi:MAG: DEAD/DEAH box helicase family protein [Candidatus Pacebacteria bacterium]|nr:DEAD/DEAH box helicase family protein [Candidatus Paceibacterota bacterium]
MINFTPEQKIKLFASIFSGRSDVYALRWEKWDGNASGYFPVYKNKGKKEFAQLTEDVIEEHLRGYKTVGVYPLLLDNTSLFVAADFDGNGWIKSIKRLLKQCKKYNLPLYIERSRSGNGGHVWWFFESRYPAFKSRKIFLHLIKESKNMDDFEKEESFDRLFPNQDYHTGKGLGNLIALPLQGKSRKYNNSVFLDSDDNFEMVADQWKLLNSIERIPTKILDDLFERFSDDNPVKRKIIHNGDKIPITLSNYALIPKKYINKQIANFLTEELNFFNNEYAIKQKMGFSVYKTERFFKTVIKDDENILIPRGFIDKLVYYFNDNGIPYRIYDRRKRCDEARYKSSLKLFNYQKDALNAFKNAEQGILVAPPGSGKTIMALSLISERKQPALIITHRKQIYDQWLSRIEDFLQIPKRKIGQIGGNKKLVKTPLTVAMVQTLARMDNLKEISEQFGLILVDECHHVPAKMFRETIVQLNPYYLYGLTATPVRKHNDEKLIFVYLGEIIHEIDKEFKIKVVKNNKFEIKINNTKLEFPYKVKAEDYQLLAKIISFDTKRNELIASDARKEVEKGRKCLILTERKEHVQMIATYFKKEFEVIDMTGDLTLKKKQEKIKQIELGHFEIIVATGQLLGEGTHFDDLDCLFLAYPFSFEGKLTQYIGRLLHGSEGRKIVYDYRDEKIEYLERMFKKRLKYYNKNYNINYESEMLSLRSKKS